MGGTRVNKWHPYTSNVTTGVGAPFISPCVLVKFFIPIGLIHLLQTNGAEGGSFMAQRR